ACLERDLARDQAFGKRVEVLNFGVSGYGTTQEYLQLRDRVWQFDPDIILLTFTVSNDVRNNSKKLEWDDIRPFYVLDNGRLVRDNSFREKGAYKSRKTPAFQALYWTINHSRILQLLREARNARLRSGVEQSNDQRAGKMGYSGIKLDEMVYLEPKDPT